MRADSQAPFFSAVHTRRLCLTHIRGRNAIRTLTYITKSNLFTVAVALGCNGFWNYYLHAHLPAAGGPDCLPLGNLNARDFGMPACLGHAQRHCAAPHEGQGGVTFPEAVLSPGRLWFFLHTGQTGGDGVCGRVRRVGLILLLPASCKQYYDSGLAQCWHSRATTDRSLNHETSKV